MEPKQEGARDGNEQTPLPGPSGANDVPPQAPVPQAPVPEDAAPQGAAETPNNTAINIKIVDTTGHTIVFRIKRDTRMQKVMAAFCERQGKDSKSVRFIFDGTRLVDDDTPRSLDLEEDDVIEAQQEQIGGTMY
ncbi:Ubiquitin-like protein SMT3 [Colletotrichum siamense]|uniref:Ubiquitin-like protein SMT3 n=1 Tax=Colletotrichum siamense TaxID=690259 RepID=A0A9P5BS22_COLSI|nr:Ubiquitin-like protein SMT3 [Colletotrichum siamense]KAF4850709.1 Ubiquitin-like protein SMT3 [Colletotrichum siamense]